MPTVPRCWKTLQRKRPSPDDAVGQVDLLGAPELLLVLGREEHARHRFGVGAVEPLLFRRHDQIAVDPHHRVAADLEVQVGGAGGDGNLQKFIEMHAPTAGPFAERRARGK